MRGPPLHTLGVPAAGFTVMLGLAILVASASGSRPAARLHEAATSYMNDLYAGDVRGAAAWRLDEDLLTAARRTRALQGGLYLIERLETDADGRAGRVGVVWYDASGRPLQAEEQVWEADAAGRWRLDRVGEALPAHHR